MVAFVVAQLPFREEESAKDYQEFLFSETGLDPVIREFENNSIVVTVAKFESIEQARAVNRILQDLTWNDRSPQVVISQFLDDRELDADDVAITVGIAPATREETEKEKAYREAYRKTDAFKEAQKKYQQSGEGRAAQRRYEQSDKGKEARNRYFQSEKYKASRRRYQEKKKMLDRVCSHCDETIRQHEFQQHVVVGEKEKALLVHFEEEKAFVIFKTEPKGLWVTEWCKDE